MRTTSRRKAALVVVLAVLVGALVGDALHLLAGGGSGGAQATAEVQGQAVWPEGLRRAPDFALRNSQGGRLRFASLRGRPVVLTFMDSQCHQQCPLVGRALAAAFRMTPAADRPLVVAISVNPWEDTPGSARRAIKRFGLAGYPWRWLLGTKAQLETVWKKYRIFVRRTSGDIEHTDAVYLIDAKGYERAGMVYPFLPNWVSNDLKTLAGESS
ncbi:MAG TPA: SCO family protein [Solirubrobacterales bacterium]|jgi:protein SCO1/2|nr:SCO family protein [Solirubrobacterales bacterium]